MIGVAVPVTGVGAIILLVWAIGAAAYNSSNSTGSQDDACYLEAWRDLGQLTPAEIDEAIRNGSFGQWRAVMVSRYGEDVVVRTGARIEREAA